MTFGKIYSVFLALTILLMLLLPKLVSLAIAALFITTLVGVMRRKMHFRFSALSALFVLLFGIYSISLIYTADLDLGLKQLEYKLSYLIFPLIFLWKPKEAIQKPWLTFSFLGGLLVLFLVGLIHSFQFLGEFSLVDSLTSSRFSFIHHPTYLSIYALFGMELFRKNAKWISSSLLIKIGIFSVLFLIQLLCMSMAGVIALFIYGSVLFFLELRKRLGTKLVSLLSIFGIVAIVLVGSLIQPVKLQFETAWNSSQDYVKDPIGFVRLRQTDVTGNETRLIMWTASYLVIKEHPFGVGIGSSDIHLTKRLKALKQSEVFINHHYDPHNQFLMTALELGIPGLIVLSTIFLFTLVLGFIKKNSLLIVLSAAVGFNCLFESVLQRQSGVVFFVLIACLLSNRKMSSKMSSRND